MTDNPDIAESRDTRFRMRPQLRSMISRGTVPIKEDVQDPKTGEWRTVIRMSRRKFHDDAKEVFLKEYAKWGRIGEAASAAGVSTQTVRKAMEDDADFGEAFLMQEQEYRDKLIGHHQDLLFNGTLKTSYDRNGQIISEERIYPIRLIEMELKKHDKGYRDKQEIEVTHSGGVLVAPAETTTIDDWEARFGKAKDISPIVDAIESEK